MSSSELSNALNPHVVAHRHRWRHTNQNSSISPTAPSVAPTVVPHPSVPHRSELELAIAASPPQPPAQIVPVPPQEQPARHVPPLVQEFYKLMATAKAATAAERNRRIAWEQEQQAKSTQVQVEMERQIMDMQQELSMLKAYISMNPSMASHLNDVQGQHYDYVQTIPTTARIEPISPDLEPLPPSTSPVSLVPHNLAVQTPLFVEGSSSHPLSAPQATSLPQSPFTFIYTLPPARSPGPPVDAHQPSIPEVVGPPTPQSIGASSPPSDPSPPRLEPTTRKRPRHVREDDSDYESDSEDTDPSPRDRPLKRKNGHDNRCLTIHQAMRIHIRKLMELQHGEELPDGPFEGVTIGADEPVRFVWYKTTKQSTVNASMKKRVINSLKENRSKYKHVPDKEFGRKILEAAFEQVFTTLRQKYKAQKDTTAAARLKLREDLKALKARRLHRKKTKLANRTEARKKLDAFSQPIFEGGLQQECMSSEESDGEYAETNGSTVQVFRTRGLPWRSARLVRFYGILDDHDKFEKSTLPKRGLGRRERRKGAPKNGLFLPPKGVARWMVSRRWLEETMAMRPDLSDILRDLIVDPLEPEAEMAQLMLGSETSDDEQDQTVPGANIYAHISDTSYSLHNALQPVA